MFFLLLISYISASWNYDLKLHFDQVVKYIENFNSRVDEGDYNNTTEVDYETEFAEGIIDILKSTTDKAGYMALRYLKDKR